MYYSIDIYMPRTLTWSNWLDTPSQAKAKSVWEELRAKELTVRVRYVEDMNSGDRWLG